MAGSWSSTETNLILLVEEISGFSGIFGYSPSPGLGNLVFSLTAANGTDPYGNVYFKGLNLGNQQGSHFGVDPEGDVFVVNSSNVIVERISSASGNMTIGSSTSSHFFFDVTNSILNAANSAANNVVQIDASREALFIYGGNPATGNLMISLAAVAGTDRVGNAYAEGVTIGSPTGARFVFDPTTETMTAFDSTNTRNFLLDPTNSVMTVWDNTLPQVTRFDGNVIGWATVTTKGASPTGTQIGNQASIAGSPSFIGIGSGVGTTANTADPVQMGIQSGASGVNSGNAFVPFVEVFDGLGTSMVDFRVSGAAVKTDLFSTPLTWQTPSYNTDWSGSTTFNGLTGWGTLQYRLDAEDNLWLIGCFKAGATAPSNPVFVLPSGYRPKTASWPVPLLTLQGSTLFSGMAYISTTGNVDIFTGINSPGAANNEYLINGKVPIGNLG